VTASPDDRTPEVADAASTPAKKTPARKPPAKRAPARTAAQNATASVDEVSARAVKQDAGADDAVSGGTPRSAAQKKPTAAAARAAALKNSNPRASAKSPRTNARTPKSDSDTANSAPKRPSASAASKTAAAKTAAERAAAAKSTARTAAAKRNTAKTAAAVAAAKTAAAKKAAAAKAAEEAAAAKAAEEAAAAKAAEEAAAALAAEAQASAAADETAEAIESSTEADDPGMGDVAPAVPNDDAFVEESVEEGSEAEEAVVEEPVVEDAAEEKAFTEEVSVGETPVEAIEVVAPESSASEAPLDMTAPDDASVQDVVDAPSDETHAVPLPEPAPLEHAVEEPSVEASAPSVAPTNASAEAIRIRGLVKTFGDHVAVNGIDLTVPAGSFYGIVGPNGAGKTTTLSIVAGLLRADSGDIVICGIDQSAQPLAAKRVMGVLPDRLRTFDRLTGRQLLYYYGLLRGLAANVIEKRVADLARAFDLGDALSRVVSDYSAGMTKKIMLAGAMIHSPRVLVLDEPFEAVDPVSSAVILDILRAYVAHGGTVILSSHGMDLVERVCSRVAIIVGGDVLAEGTIDEVRAGQTLESRFVELAGSSGEVEGLEWLHTFSD